MMHLEGWAVNRIKSTKVQFHGLAFGQPGPCSVMLSLLSPLPSISSNQGGTTLSSLEPPKVAGEQ